MVTDRLHNRLKNARAFFKSSLNTVFIEIFILYYDDIVRKVTLHTNNIRFLQTLLVSS